MSSLWKAKTLNEKKAMFYKHFKNIYSLSIINKRKINKKGYCLTFNYSSITKGIFLKTLGLQFKIK